MTGRILIAGGGAIGGVARGPYRAGGHDVTVLDADQDHTAALRDPGLLLEEVNGAPAAGRVGRRRPHRSIPLRITHGIAGAAGGRHPLVEQHHVDAYVSLGNGLV